MISQKFIKEGEDCLCVGQQDSAVAQTNAGLYTGLAELSGVLQVSQEHGKTCCTADIPHVAGLCSSLGFLRLHLLVLHAAEQPVLQNEGNLLSLHYILCFCSFHPHSKCSMHWLLMLGLNSVVRQCSGLKVKLLLSTE